MNSLREEAKLAALTTVYLVAAIPGTVLGIAAFVLWSVATEAEAASQPYLRREPPDDIGGGDMHL